MTAGAYFPPDFPGNLRSASDRNRPLSETETYYSAKILPAVAAKLYRRHLGSLAEDERLLLITQESSTGSAFKRVLYFTDRRIYQAINRASPAPYGIFELSDATVVPYTTHPGMPHLLARLALMVNGKRHKLGLYARMDIDLICQFVERAHQRREVEGRPILEELAIGRENFFRSFEPLRGTGTTELVTRTPKYAPSPSEISVPVAEPISETSQAGIDNIISQLKQLSELHASGVLTDEEYTRAKTRLGLNG